MCMRSKVLLRASGEIKSYLQRQAPEEKTQQKLTSLNLADEPGPSKTVEHYPQGDRTPGKQQEKKRISVL